MHRAELRRRSDWLGYLAANSGLVAMGRLFGGGHDRHVEVLHDRASDDRWRVREGVAIAVQRACDDDPERGFALPRFVALESSTDPDVAWIVRENHKKARLQRLLAAPRTGRP